MSTFYISIILSKFRVPFLPHKLLFDAVWDIIPDMMNITSTIIEGYRIPLIKVLSHPVHPVRGLWARHENDMH
jgi:hypothetical protein